VSDTPPVRAMCRELQGLRLDLARRIAHGKTVSRLGVPPISSRGGERGGLGAQARGRCKAQNLASAVRVLSVNLRQPAPTGNNQAPRNRQFPMGPVGRAWRPPRPALPS
jgi:hypothetical protein